MAIEFGRYVVSLRAVIIVIHTAIFVIKPQVSEQLVPMPGHWGWDHTKYYDRFWDRDSSWDRDLSWDWTDGDSRLLSTPTTTKSKISTLGMKHSLPLEARREILQQFFNKVCSKIKMSFPTLYISTWNARVVQAAIYLVCRLEPNYPARAFLDEENQVNVDDGVRILMQGFIACYSTDQKQEHIIKFLSDHAIQNKDAIIDKACQHGFDPLQVEDRGSGSGARFESRSGVPYTSRHSASPQGPSEIQDLDEEMQQVQKEKQVIDMKLQMLQSTKELQSLKKQQQHVPQAIAADSITEANPSIAALQQAMIAVFTKFNEDLRENPTSQLQTQPEADLGNAKEAQDQHKGQQEATSLKVATTVVNKLPEAQAQLVAQENRTPNQAVTELQTQAEATTLMVAQTDEAQAQAKGQQQETQATSLTATLFGASDNGDNTSHPNSDDNNEGSPLKRSKTE